MASQLDVTPGAHPAQIGARYQVDALLGRGGMATVYRVTDAATAAAGGAQAARHARGAVASKRDGRPLRARVPRAGAAVAPAGHRGLRLRRRRDRAVLHDGAPRRRRPARASSAAVATSVHLALRRLLVAGADPLAPPGPPRRQPRQHLVHPRRGGQAHRLWRAGADGRGDVDRGHAGLRGPGGGAAIGAGRAHRSLLVRGDAVLRPDGASAVSGAEFLAARGALEAGRAGPLHVWSTTFPRRSTRWSCRSCARSPPCDLALRSRSCSA